MQAARGACRRSAHAMCVDEGTQGAKGSDGGLAPACVAASLPEPLHQGLGPLSLQRPARILCAIYPPWSGSGLRAVTARRHDPYRPSGPSKVPASMCQAVPHPSSQRPVRWRCATAGGRSPALDPPALAGAGGSSIHAADIKGTCSRHRGHMQAAYIEGRHRGQTSKADAHIHAADIKGTCRQTGALMLRGGATLRG